MKKIKKSVKSIDLFKSPILKSYLNSESVNNELIRKLLKEIVLKTNNDNFNNMIDNFGNKIKEILNNSEIKEVGTTILSILATILNYKCYMPIHKKTVSEALRKDININIFWGIHCKNIEDFKQFMKTTNKIREELGIDSMLEVAYYLSKFEGGENMTVKVIENKIPELEKRLRLWKNFVNFVGKRYLPHYDLTSESNWLKIIEKIKNIVEKLEVGEENTEELIKKLFIYQDKDCGWKLIFAGGNVGVFKGFISNAPEEQLKKFVDIIIEVKNSNEFKDEWINKTYNLICEFNRQGVENYGESKLKKQLYNIFGELYGKLHIEREPIMNTCSRNILKEFYDFGEYNYNEFKEAFEMLKQKYKEIVGKLSEFSNGFINLEIDIMFNFFDKTKVWLLAPGKNAKYLEEFYKNNKIFIGWGDIGNLSKQDLNNPDDIKKLIMEKYSEEYNKEPRAAHKMLFDFYKNMNIGDIVVLRRGLKEVVGICKITGDYKYLTTDVPSDYNHSRNVEFIWFSKKGVKLDFSFTQSDTLQKIDNWDTFIKIFEKILNEDSDKVKNSEENIISKELKEKIDKILEKKGQIILYGVPGTGKTYSALKYVEGKGYYKFITFHQSYSYEDFIEGFKPKTTEDGNITYEVEDGIFKRLCILAIWEVLKDKEDIKKEIDLDRLLDKALKEFEDRYPVGSVLKTKMGKEFEIIDYKYEEDRIKSIKIKIESKNEKSLDKSDLEEIFKKALIEGYEIKGPGDIKKIKDTGLNSYYFAMYSELKEIINNIGYIQDENSQYKLSYDEIKEKVIKKLKEHEETKNVFKKEDFQNAKKYYLIIDEINRGNISNILGELITLLEKDKRLSEDNEIIVELPYSKELFAVPPNLYIIGTMNTADRSIALLDIALRRRFGFLEIEPNYDLINKEIEGINLKKLLESLNEKLMKLKDRDHRIGHSYFLNIKDLEDLEFVWYHEIIPLLEEYFYGDVDGLKEVLKDFIEKKENSYEIKRLTGEEFKNAINKI
ncbi:ATPase [Methanocaldococcus villosus KIN24-T80]|uniref:ATPase n=1 Tax=Methanocaldococcus villosus KIN24-T80 TaxID=1069083 RepID=N6W004_9EURY|nr:AAA family ATPase [Methanocaldococcus villosus]ENN96677.1 ATPase [Methanocaldococcus villosus KIN24-T80]